MCASSAPFTTYPYPYAQLHVLVPHPQQRLTDLQPREPHFLALARHPGLPPPPTIDTILILDAVDPLCQLQLAPGPLLALARVSPAPAQKRQVLAGKDTGLVRGVGAVVSLHVQRQHELKHGLGVDPAPRAVLEVQVAQAAQAVAAREARGAVDRRGQRAQLQHQRLAGVEVARPHQFHRQGLFEDQHLRVAGVMVRFGVRVVEKHAQSGLGDGAEE